MKTTEINPIKILLVEDNPGDIRLTREALKEGKLHNELYVTEDGVKAMQFLRKQDEFKEAIHPDLILLDLNLPRKDGREVLKEIKDDKNLKHIPVVIMTTSTDEQDILTSYNLHANCYITKPVDFNQFTKVVNSVSEFWFTVVKLPV